MKKINIEFIIPENMSFETLQQIMNNGISTSRAEDQNGDIFGFEMAQVIDSSKCLIISSKKVCTSESDCGKIESPQNNGGSDGETSHTICS